MCVCNDIFRTMLKTLLTLTATLSAVMKQGIIMHSVDSSSFISSGLLVTRILGKAVDSSLWKLSTITLLESNGDFKIAVWSSFSLHLGVRLAKFCLPGVLCQNSTARILFLTSWELETTVLAICGRTSIRMRLALTCGKAEVFGPTNSVIKVWKVKGDEVHYI